MFQPLPKVKYSHTYTTGFDGRTVLTVLAPGASTGVARDRKWPGSHGSPEPLDLRPPHRIITSLWACNFTQSGFEDYIIEPSNLFTYVDTDGEPVVYLR